MDTHEKFRQDQKKLLSTIQQKLAAAASNPTSTPITTKLKGVKMEDSKAPTFSGRTLDYPEFKRGWKAVAGVHWEDANQVEQLKLKVDDTTRKIISRCKNMDDVWQALDLEYAQEQEVIMR